MADLSFVNRPRISLALFARVLADADSPAAPEAVAIYAALVARGLDPAVALAFFQHESSYGLKGVARSTRNWGNLRKSQGRATKVEKGWAHYATWAASAEDWADLIMRRYVGRGLATVRVALPVYAPSSDNNVPERYADAVVALVGRWSAAEQATADRRYVVREAARLRAGPSRQHSHIRTLPAGLVVSVDHIVADGEAVPSLAGPGTTRRWAALAGGGYVWAELLRPHEGDV